MHIYKSYLYGNLSARQGLAGSSVRFVCGVDPTFMNSMDEAVALVFGQIVRLLNMVVGLV